MHCTKDDDADSEDDDLDNKHLLDKRRVAGHWVETFFMEERDEDVSTWTLVAKELLTVRMTVPVTATRWLAFLSYPHRTDPLNLAFLYPYIPHCSVWKRAKSYSLALASTEG